MTIKQKVVSACLQANINQTELAKRLGMSQQNFSKRLKVGKFTELELIQIAKALGCEYHSYFEFSDGTKIE